MIPKRILIIDDEENFRHLLSVILVKEGYEVETASNGEEGLQKALSSPFDQILCDIRMAGMEGLEFLKEVKKTEVEATIIVMSAYGTVDIAIEAMKLGAYDYISKPFKPDEIILTLRKAEERGTGKELVARALHYNSERSQNPFIPVNCGAIPENLLESELFGHAKGAFTDAIRTKKGLFEEADGGTLFLDEIGELPSPLQVKLLRVLQEGEIRRVGESKPIQVDVRIVAATVKDLAKEASEGKFRDDLFYRLNVLPIHIPPLRERKEDIPLLIQHFIGKYNKAMSKNVADVDHKALETLINYKWYGNVRELENTVERAIVLSEKNNIELDNLPIEIQNFKEEFQVEQWPDEEYSIKKTSKNLEINLIKKALKKTKGNHTHAAKLLEIRHPALLYKIKENGIVK